MDFESLLDIGDYNVSHPVVVPCAYRTSATTPGGLVKAVHVRDKVKKRRKEDCCST